MDLASMSRSVRIIKTITVVLASIIGIAGLAMIFLDIKDLTIISIETENGSIDIECAYVGTVALVLAAILLGICLLSKFSYERQTTIVKKPDGTIIEESREKGMAKHIDEGKNKGG